MRCASEGMHSIGPAPADTAFTPHMLRAGGRGARDVSRPGLPVIKYAGFGDAVNVTLGLPIIRTSVDHGTALALAGTGTGRRAAWSPPSSSRIAAGEPHQLPACTLRANASASTSCTIPA